MNITIKILGIQTNNIDKFCLYLNKDESNQQILPLKDEMKCSFSDNQSFITFEVQKDTQIIYQTIINTFLQKDLIIIYNYSNSYFPQKNVTCFYKKVSHETVTNVTFKNKDYSFTITPTIINEDKKLYCFYLLNFSLSFSINSIELNITKNVDPLDLLLCCYEMKPSKDNNKQYELKLFINPYTANNIDNIKA